MIRIILVTGLLLFQTVVQADDFRREEILTIDEPISGDIPLEFTEYDDLEPKLGDFEILSAIFMSNLAGDRWATVTIKNRSHHQRLLDREHIVALFANGERRNPFEAEYNFKGQEHTSLVISFGKSKFPILRLLVRN